MSLIFFKIWSQVGHKSVIYLSSEQNDLKLNLIVKASEKFKINGSKIVLKKDGTEIEDDLVLKHFQNETLILLEPNELWHADLDLSLTCLNTLDPITIQTVNSISGGEGSSEISSPMSFEPYPIINIQSSISNPTSEDITEPVQVDCNGPFRWQSFDVPWENFPKNIIDDCEKGKFQNAQTKTYIIQTVVNNMRQINSIFPASAVHIITNKIIEKYPKMFRDIDEDGVVIGDGSHSLFRKILDRNNYLNRKKRAAIVDDTNEANPVKNKKIRVSERAGCVSFNPDASSTNNDSLENISLTEEDPDFQNKFKSSFPMQRTFVLTKNPSVDVIKKEWPTLLCKEGIFLHFELLTGSSCKTISNIISIKLEKFLKLASSSKYVYENNKPTFFKILKIAAHELKEKICSFYKDFEVDNIKECLDNISQLHPVIVKISSSEDYYLLYEKEVIAENDFDTVFLMAFALFFNFNLKYPVGIGLTFDLIQKYIFKIYPDAGDKIAAKRQTSKSKVITLIKKLNKL